MFAEIPGWFAWNVKLAASVVKPEKRGFTSPWQTLVRQEKILFKWLFPLLFMLSAATLQAQPQSPSGPLFDPQGRLIPYDPPSEASDPPPPARKPKAAAQAKPGKKSAAKPGAKRKAGKAAAKGGGKAGKSAAKVPAPKRKKAQ